LGFILHTTFDIRSPAKKLSLREEQGSARAKMLELAFSISITSKFAQSK
jgi:hypothetical protein